MTKFRVLLAGLVVVLVLTMIQSETKAQNFFGRQTWNVQGFGVSGNLYGLGFIPTPPYYAIHPPVYYGQRYFRTYGESPFARPARAMRPLNVSVQIVKNPYVEQLPPVIPSLPEAAEVEAAEVQDQVATKGQMILNPYYRVEDKVAQK